MISGDFPYPYFPCPTLYSTPVLSPVHGCICPPGANKDCESPICPRKLLQGATTCPST